MSAPGMTTGLRRETFENLQLNAGVLLKNFDLTDIATADALKTAIIAARSDATKWIGATRGGGTFTATREMRTPEIDGLRYPFIGGRFVDSVDANLSATLVEVTAQNIKAALGSVDIDTSTATKTVITMHTAIDTADYVSNLVWVGDISDGRYVAIELYNALNTADFSLTFSDKSEGTIPLEMHAHQSDVMDYDTAPFRIVFFDPSGTLTALTVASAAGTAVGGTALTITGGSATSGQSWVYKIGTSSAAPSIAYHETPDYTWTVWDGSSDIAVGTGANGKKITVAIIDSNAKCVASGNAVLTVKTA